MEINTSLWTCLHCFYPSPSEIKWAITDRCIIQGTTFTKTFFTVFVHRTCPYNGTIHFRNILHMVIYSIKVKAAYTTALKGRHITATPTQLRKKQVLRSTIIVSTCVPHIYHILHLSSTYFYISYLYFKGSVHSRFSIVFHLGSSPWFRHGLKFNFSF
jgi:hypothetical protein